MYELKVGDRVQSPMFYSIGIVQRFCNDPNYCRVKLGHNRTRKFRTQALIKVDA